MVRLAFVSLVLTGSLTGCLFQHEVEVDRSSVEVPRGATVGVRVIVDGVPLTSMEYVTAVSDDEDLATALPMKDGVHIGVGGNLEGETMIHINVHGTTIDVPTRIGPPAIMQMWIEPSYISSSLGGSIQVQALGLDTLARVVDISGDSRWTMRDEGVAKLDLSGMMVHGMGLGQTTLHAVSGDQSTVIPITILK